jgi:hypothetical protein
MKSFNMFAILILFLMAISFQAFAQRDVSQVNNGAGYTYITHFDTVKTAGGNVSSTAFTFDNLAANWSTYPFNIEVTAVATSGTPKGIIYIQKGITATGTFTNADTLLSSDSTYTNWCTQVDFNNWKFPYYKIKYVTTSVSGAVVKFTTSIGNPRKN